MKVESFLLLHWSVTITITNTHILDVEADDLSIGQVSRELFNNGVCRILEHRAKSLPRQNMP